MNSTPDDFRACPVSVPVVIGEMAPPPDQRSDLAKARDAWLESEEGRACMAATSAEEIRYCAALAFLAGVDWAVKRNQRSK